MKKILLVFGTRPEAIKMAPLVNELKSRSGDFNVTVCVTGQHRQMLDQVLDLFGIKPEYDLNIMSKGQDLYDVTSKVLLGMRDILAQERPDIILVHGDTTTSTAAAMAGYYQRIPVGHVEAGLRTNDIYSPWPEEVNRQITARIAAINFAPTELSAHNLASEGVDKSKIIITGNTVIDALLAVREKLMADEALRQKVYGEIKDMGYDLSRKADGKKIILITAHRRENFGEGFINIFNAIKRLATENPDVDFVYPMHLNPNVRRPIEEVFLENGKTVLPNIFLIEPLDYLPFVCLMGESHIVMTDSGGIQEEAPGLGIPVLVLRNTTERPEAVAAGTVRLVGTNEKEIVSQTSRLLGEPDYYRSMSQAVNPYGDGFAAKRIADHLIQ